MYSKKNILIWLPIYFFGFISFTLLYEWWNIKINKATHEYAWGTVNDNSWFYETSGLYANVMLTEGLIMLFLVIMSIRALTIRPNKFNYWLLTCLLFTAYIFFSANTK